MKPSAQTDPKDAQIALMAERISVLENQLDWFKRQLFGRKSEKQNVSPEEQSGLFVANPQTPITDSETDAIEIRSHRRTSRKQRRDGDVNDTGLRFDESVPQQVIDVPAPELQGEDADQYEVIGHEQTCRLAQQPGSYVVMVYRRPVVRHKTCQTVNTPQAPANVLEGCYADVSLVAGLMVDKAVYHLPLYRQHQRMQDSGITLSRATLVHWMQKGCELLRPVYDAQWQNILGGNTLAMDEVPMKAGQKKGAGKTPGRMKQSYFWPIYGEQDEVAFTWSASRGMAHARSQLSRFTGTLLTDGYTAYNRTVAELNRQEEKIIHANCWAHGRRSFEKALTMEPDAAQQALDQIAALYRVEKKFRDAQMEAAAIRDYRQRHSEPIVTAFFQWVYQQRQRSDLLPSNPLAKALAYVHERERQLRVFLGNPHVPIDTNHLERALRVIPLGRKNHLFCWTEMGAEQLGILQSLMVTCRLQGINPYTYLVDVLQRVSQHPAKDVTDLTPRVWKTRFAKNFLTSDLAEMG